VNTIYLWIALVSPEELLTSGRPWSPAAKREIILFLAAVGILTLSLLFWVVFIRKPSRRHHSHRHHRRHRHEERPERSGMSAKDDADEEDPADDADDIEEDADGGGSRRRRRRREHRPRNPTLAETGGLPPIRDQPPQDGSSS